MIADRDFIYAGLPWRAGGRSREGLDCAGLALLFLREEFDLDLPAPDTTDATNVDVDAALLEFGIGVAQELQRGDLVFFRNLESGKIVHVAVCLGGPKILHIVHGCESRIDNGFKLAERLKLRPAHAVARGDVAKLAAVLHDPAIGEIGAGLALIISLVLSAVSYALTPKLSRQGNKYGRYGFDALVTKNTPEQPLPDLLGSVVVAGNSPYTQQREQSAVATATLQKANKIVVLASGPSEEIDYQTGLKLNGMGWNDPFFYSGSQLTGMFVNPAQTKAEAVTGTILGDTNVPSVSLYDGAHAVSVPVDVRAQYDREFPLYGLSGCTYLVFRLVDSTKYQNFNVTCRVKARRCRTFDSSGFVTDVSGVVDLFPDSVATRLKLDHDDIHSITLVTINSMGFTQMDATHQSGSVYSLNATKGYLEFLTAPASGGVNKVSYGFYVREWSQNPAMQLVYLLTEKLRGLGLPDESIDWAAAEAFRDYCDTSLTYQSANGELTGPRWVSDYAVDFRKPIQEHIQAILDASHAILFVSGGKWVMKAIGADSSVFSFNMSNILEGSFSSTMIDRAERANRIKVLFHSEEAHNAESEVIVDHPDDQRQRSSRAGNNGIVDANLKLTAVTNPAQAERIGLTHLEEEVSARYRASWKTNIKGLALQVGDVVDVTHASRPSWAAKGFRIEELGHDENDHLEITAIEYTPGAYL